MTSKEFKTEVIQLLEKYNFKYDKIIARQRDCDVDVWLYYTNRYGYQDKQLINSYNHADTNGSVEWYIKQLAVMEGYADDETEVVFTLNK